MIETYKINKYFNLAFILSIITIIYNIFEGIVSVFFGAGGESLSLFGFGVDSFIEVISGIGIMHMIMRMKKEKIADRDKFEKRALYITGISFIILTAGLIIGCFFNIINKTKPETTIPGIIISGISILTMFILYKAKMHAGIKLESDAIISDAKCTLTCFYLSFVLLGASLLYAVFKISYIDIIGSAFIAYFSFREGLESLEKASKKGIGCSCEGSC